jgi:SAM-dependent methyltransferase
MFSVMLKRLLFMPGSSLNKAAKINIARLNERMKNFSNPIILNLGSGERFVGEESLDKKVIQQIVNLDISYYPSVSVIGNAHSLPFKDSSFSGIICQGVLEHVEHPEKVVEDIWRTLKKEGVIYAEAPFLQGYHPSPGDYFRFTLDGLTNLFSGFSSIDMGISVGPSSTLSWILREYLTGIITGFSQNRHLRNAALFVTGWLTFPLKYLDIFYAKKKGAHRIASGLFYLGKKK